MTVPNKSGEERKSVLSREQQETDEGLSQRSRASYELQEDRMGCDCQPIGSLKNAGLLNLNSKRKAINVCNSYRTDNFNHPLSQVLHFINEKT